MTASASKRADLPRQSTITHEFAKDWEKLTHSGRYNMRRIKEVMMLLVANDMPLAAEWKDHALQGAWADHRECHVGGDFLLIYRLERAGAKATVAFVRAGTHAQLFG